MEGKTLGIYLHIPFCESRCPYCGFLSSANYSDMDRRDYVKLLCREIALSGPEASELTHDSPVDTIFLGGGSPSILHYSEIEDILKTLAKTFKLSKRLEITMEANPSSLSLDQVKAFQYYGGNRISIGGQSFSEEILKVLGRIHRPDDICKAVEIARLGGIDNINLDLIFAIPGQGMRNFMDSLDRALALTPKHLSFYGLQIEEGSQFYKDYKMERMPEIDEKLAHAMYYKAIDRLETAGYKHYEVSNASLEGYYSRHNIKYWKYDNYLGLGLGAGSFLRPMRGKNPSNHKLWEEGLINQLPLLRRCKMVDEGEDEEKKVFIMTGLRLRRGMEVKQFNDTFKNSDFDQEFLSRKPVQEMLKAGKLKLNSGYLTIAKDHILHSNSITEAFF